MDGGIIPPIRQVTEAEIFDRYRMTWDMIAAWIDRTFGMGIMG